MDGNAIILTGGLLLTPAAKTAHGLIRGTERYNIQAIIDPKSAGQDAGILVDGTARNIPIYATVEEFLQHGQADHCIVGIANAGGKLPPDLMPEIRQAIQGGMSIVCGLHEFLSDHPEIGPLAAKHGVKLIDVRKPRPRSELHFWSGAIFDVSCSKIAVMGIDCAVGKRTTARFLTEACQQQGINAQMIYTGQTGWMQGGKYGFILDSTLNDFVSGELEHAIVSCYKETQPDVIFIEGQAALRNPSGPCGSEYLVSGNVDGVILQVIPHREYYKGWGQFDLKIPPIAQEIALIEMYGSKVLAVTINTQQLTPEEAQQFKSTYEQELNIPVVLPVEEGVDSLIPLITTLVS